jgi:RHS repeat-associated protein
MNRLLRAGARAVAAALALVALATAARGQVLSNHTGSITTYMPSAASSGQDVRPQVNQRGVHIDGSLRAGAAQMVSIGANPFEPGSGTSRRLGDVDLATGSYGPMAVDLSLPAPGAARWVVGRTFNHIQRTSGAALRTSDGPQGFNWFQMSQPEIVVHDPAGDSDDAVYLVYGADRFAEFVKTGAGSTVYTGRNGAGGVFQYVSGSPDTWVYNDPSGVKLYFFGGNTSSGRADYQFWKVVDEAGNTAYVGDASTASTAATSGYNTDKTINVAYDGISGDGRRYSYTYSSIGGRNRLTQVTAETKTSGAWSSPSGVVEVARVIYDYYTADGDAHGMAGDLKLVTVRTALSDSGSSLSSGIYLEKKTYYRYYDDTWSNSDGRRGSPHQIKMVLEAEGCRKYDWDQDGNLDDDFLTASDASLKPYSSAYLEYVSGGDDRVAGGFFDGACGCSGGINGAYTLSYSSNGSFPGTSGYDTAWKDRAVVTQPDAIWFTQYFDETGQPLSRVITDADPAGSPTDMWATEIVRDSSGRVSEVRTPAANTGYTHSTGALTASTSVGLIHAYTRVSGGNQDGFVEAVKWKEGTSGTAYFVSYRAYSNLTKSVGTATLVRPYVSTSRSYKTQTSSTGVNGTDYDQTTVSQVAFSSSVAPKSVTTTFPAVHTASNGSGASDTTTQYFRADGTKAFDRGKDTTHTYTRYTNGLPVKRIADAQTNSGTDFASGDDPNTDFGITESASGLRLVSESTFDSVGRPATATLPSGRVMRMYSSRLADGRMVTLSIPRETSGPTTYYGPVAYTVSNHAGRPEASGTIAIGASGSTTALSGWIDESDSDQITAVDVGTLKRLSTTIYSKQGTRAEESRAYFLIPGSGAGADGMNYDATFYGYDDMGRQRRVKDPTGTISRVAFDDLGRTYQRYIGTNDSSFAGGESSGVDTMVKTEELQYDGGADGGNSYLTQRTAFVEGSSTGQRVTTYTNDARGRTVLVSNPQAPHSFNKFDNLGRVTASGLFSSTASIVVGTDDPTTETTNRMGLTQTFYDDLGRVWKSQRHKIDDADGSDDDNLQTLTWYDAAGRVIKVDGEQLVKYSYDRLGRTTNMFVLSSDNDSVYADMDDVTGDTVLEQHVTMIESSTSNTLASIAILRHFSDTSTTGALDSNADADDLTLTAANVKGRVSITATWYDSLDRPIDTVQYGTNAIVGDGSTSTGTFSRSGLSTPSRSATALRTTTEYDTDGTVVKITDPRNMATKYGYDDAGRQITEIRNFTSGSTATAVRDNDLYTRRVYTDGLMTQLWVDLDADNVQDADDQVTIYTYGVTKGAGGGGAGDSKISSGRLLWKTQYPDSSGGTDVVSLAYNAQGQEIYKKDQLGGVVETDYDTGGRITHKRVTTVGIGLDNAVLRISMTYDSLGRVLTVTQYNNATVGSGTALDEVKYTYDDWGPVSSLEQDFNGTVGGGGDDKDVSFAYAKATGGRNTIRRSSVTIPGQTITIDYDTLGPSAMPSNSSRPRYIKLGGTTVAEYSYTGASMLVGTRLSQPAVFKQAYAVGAASGVYANLDRFNRVTSDLWIKDLATDRTFVNLAIAYDENSNITSVTDAILATPAGTRTFDALYTMDGLDRVTTAEEGNFNGSTISTRSRSQTWSLSQTGNWGTEELDLDGTGGYETTNTGTFNTVNEMLTRSGHSGISYDANGNLTDDGITYDYVYDAWNRLRTVKTQAGATVAEYRYNGLNQRIGWHYDVDADNDVDSNDNWFYFLNDDRWRIVASYRGNGGGTTVETNPKERFIYHMAGWGGAGGSSYIDSVILRDRDDTSGWNSSSDGTLEERRYYIQNWRADVVALLKDTGVMVERIKYSAYGVPFNLPMGDVDCDGDTDSTDLTQISTWVIFGTYSVLGDVDLDGDVDGNDHTTSSGNTISTGRGVLSYSSTGNRIGYAGYQAGPELAGTKWHVRNRFLNSDTGRWNTRDPLELQPGLNMYQYVLSMPLMGTDPQGTDFYNPGNPDQRYRPPSTSAPDPGVTPGPPTITIRCKKISRLPASHCYLVCTSPDGTSRGCGGHPSRQWPVDPEGAYPGEQGPWGPIRTVCGPTNKIPEARFPDDPNDPLGGERTTPVVPPEGTSTSSVCDCITAAMGQIDSCRVTYDPVLGPNSNTVAHAVLRRCCPGCSYANPPRSTQPPIGWDSEDGLTQLGNCLVQR